MARSIIVSMSSKPNPAERRVCSLRRRSASRRLQAETASLIPVGVVHETHAPRVAIPPDARDVGNPTARAGTIEIRIGAVVIKVDGVVDADTLRVVLGSVRA